MLDFKLQIYCFISDIKAIYETGRRLPILINNDISGAIKRISKQNKYILLFDSCKDKIASKRY